MNEPEALKPGRTDDDGVEAPFLHARDPGRHVSAEIMDGDVRPAREELRLTPER